MDERRLEARLDAVERAVTGGEPIPELADAAEAAVDGATRERRLDDLEERVAELEAATQALRGYVGNVRSVNERVEERADAAAARAEDLERRVAALESAETGADAPENSSVQDESEAPPAASKGPSDQPSQPRETPRLSSAEDPSWLAAADDRLPDETSRREPEAEASAESGDGLAARLGELL